MTNPITTLVGSGKIRDDMDTLNTNFARRLAHAVVTLTNDAVLVAADGGTRYRLDGTTNAIDVTLPSSAGLHVGWTVAFVLVNAANAATVTPASGNVYGGNGGSAASVTLTAVWTQAEVEWTGTEWLLVRFFAPTP